LLNKVEALEDLLETTNTEEISTFNNSSQTGHRVEENDKKYIT